MEKGGGYFWLSPLNTVFLGIFDMVGWSHSVFGSNLIQINNQKYRVLCFINAGNRFSEVIFYMKK